MHTWKPITCDCEFETQGTEWIKTIKKCQIHKNLTGKKLYQEVQRHNREIGKSNADPAKGEYIEGWFEAEFEPTWLAGAMKKPTMLKIAEAEYNFKRMTEFHPTNKEFQFYLSNFLSSIRSVLYYFLQEYSKKYDVNFETFFKDLRYRNRVDQSLSNKCKEFIKWYESEYEKLIDNKTNGGFLINKRDFNIHTGYVKPIFKFIQPFHYSAKQLKEKQVTPLNWNELIPVFSENHDADMRILCERFMESVKHLVKQVNEKF